LASHFTAGYWAFADHVLENIKEGNLKTRLGIMGHGAGSNHIERLVYVTNLQITRTRENL
jgi:hypothetical protein